MLFDSYFTFESKLGWHRLFLTVESTRGIRTLVVVFELLEEMVAWGCRNGRFNEQFQILPLELKVKFIWMLSYVFLTVLDLPARFISATLHDDKSLKMAAKLGDCLTFSKLYLEFDRFSRVWLKLNDKVSFKSSCLLDWNVMLTKVSSMDKIDLIYMAVVFF